MLTVVNQWKPNVTDLTNATVGHTVVKLLNECHEKECNIGNLITDSYVYYVSTDYHYNLLVLILFPRRANYNIFDTSKTK